MSVIVPIRNEELHIEDTLNQLLDQEHGGIDLEILVLDGCSTDRTREIVQRMASQNKSIRLFENSRLWASSARNIGIAHSSGDYVVIIDGHCEIPNRTYFKDLVNAFDRTGAHCLGRPQPLDVTEASNLQRAVAAARSSWLGHHPDSFIYSNRETKALALSVAVAYRRELFDRIGLFDEAFDACEDCELNHRIDKAGLSCYLIPELAVKYKPRTSFADLFFQLARYGRGRVRLWRKHRDSFAIGSIIPAGWLTWLLLGPIICMFLPVLWYVYLALFGSYIVAILGVSLQVAIKSNELNLFFWLPFVFATIHAGSGWGVLAEIVSLSSAKTKRH